MNASEPKLGDFFKSRREKGVDGLPTLSVTLDRGLIPRGSLDRRTETELEATEHLLVRSGDIAYNMMRMWQGASGLADRDAIVSPAYIVLEPRNNLDSRYAAYLFKLPQMVHRFWSYSYGLTEDRLRLYWNDFQRIPWNVPPLSEQKKIADILSTWDVAIETAEKLLANAEQQKRALMQQLLTGKRRLKGFEGSRWAKIPLSQLALVLMGSSPPSSAYNESSDGLPLIQGNADLESGVSAPRMFTGIVTQECLPGDSLLSVRAPVGTVARSLHRACIGRGIAALRARSESDQEWLHQWLLWFEPQWKSVSQGSTFEAVNSSEIRGLEVLTSASEKERAAVASLLANGDKAIRIQRQNLVSLSAEKSALMQQLLTGKRRVTV